MKKPKPLNLSLSEELSIDEMRNLKASFSNDLLEDRNHGKQVDSTTALWEASKTACYGKREGDDCQVAYGTGLPFDGKCQNAIEALRRTVLVCGTNHGSGSGSGSISSGTTGTSWWDDFWNSDLKPQREGCNGKKTGDLCSWTDNGSINHGTCNFDYTTHYLLCANTTTSGTTGAISARQAACLNKVPGNECWFTGDSGAQYRGYCRIDSFSWHMKLLACYTDISSSTPHDNEDNEDNNLKQ